MVSFFSMILSYFYFLPCPFIDCQGKLPLRKQSKTQMRDSKSSLLPCSIPKCVLIEAQRAVPVRSLLSLYAMCSLYFPIKRFARPKSIMQILPMFCLLPIKKLSGLRSRCRTPLEWMKCMSFSIYIPIKIVVLRVKLRSHRLSRSQREFPKRSITITQQLPSLPILNTLGMFISSPISLDLARSMMNLDQSRSCDRFTLALYIFSATQDPSFTLRPRYISPKAPSPNFLTISQQPSTRRGLSGWFMLFIPIIIIIPTFAYCLNQQADTHVPAALSQRIAQSQEQDQTRGRGTAGGCAGRRRYGFGQHGRGEALHQGYSLHYRDIQHKIQDIRQWRDHQTSLLKEKLASNQAVAKVTIDEYLKHLQKQDELEAEERQKLMKKLQVVGQQMQLQAGQAKGWSNPDTNLFQCLTASNRNVNERKYELRTEEVPSNSQALINDLQNISQAILRRQDKITLQASDKKVVDRALLKKQLQEIDDQLREIEQLLKD